MSQIEIQIPSMGEGITEATITKWHVKEGDTVTEDQIIVDLATDKVDNELPSISSGIIAKILYSEGQTIQVGKTIAIISSDGKLSGTVEKSNTPVEIKTVAAKSPEKLAEEAIDKNEDFDVKMALSPLVRNMVRENHIGVSDLAQISGSGYEGRITKEDITRFLERSKTPVQTIVPEEIRESVRTVPKPSTSSSVDYSVFGQVEIVEMDRMRKLIAGHMKNSMATSPHVTSFAKADVTNLFNWRNSYKTEFERKEGEKLTLMPLFIKEIARVLKEFPAVNVSVDGDNIVYKKYFNIGMATALPDNNLIVPVIRNADQKNLYGLAKAVNDLAERARTNRLNPEEIKGGTFTITNLGSFGTLTGTPIINQPEAAILALGAVRKEPAVIETEQGDAIAIRQIMMLALTYDHRVIDGALAGKFLQRLVYNIENFDINSLV
ncbi:MAG: diapophytoene dehydrogenase [Bacteroidetes bacterium HGW-Bacteroidetes-21]|jgi:2-oxoglutarate dehydrogenase E2 component (dihydrolipoamide succinyltransferase)|nr:MAG: diapophytoene dehydrogenase [Bacteroidetes bacterium HGW-Bacteroidetes-21]